MRRKVGFKLIHVCVVLALTGCVHQPEVISYTCSSTHPVSWSKDVSPVIALNCASKYCHSEVNNAIVHLSNLQELRPNMPEIRKRVADGNMPPGNALSPKDLYLITCWIDQGAKEN